MGRTLFLSLIVAGFVAFASRAAPPQDEPLPEVVLFNRDIRPLLSDACFHCHGPDKARRKGSLRLDRPEDAYADRGGYRLLVPGEPGKSELLRRLTAEEPAERMPPAASGRKVTPRQIALVRRWIEQGARWQQHWAFLPPERPAPPAIRNPQFAIRNPIDRFILARLEKEGLSPAPETDKVTLIRRVSLDLTGLPPTPAEVDVFVNDRSPDAYEKVVDRLLASPRYGERMAYRWLEAARYADTNGYQTDGERQMWRWRDWVIEAYNRSLPFDQFTIEQLAGDLLPNATLDQKIATGFNRNHRGNSEGGIIPEEYAVEYVCDRVETTATVWLGLTLGCARCHEHKYDPFPQKDYYRLFAYFNNVPEHGRAIKYGNSPPYIKAPTREQQERLARLDTKLAKAEAAWRDLQPRLIEAQSAWEKALSPKERIDWTPSEHLAARFPLDGSGQTGEPGASAPPAASFEGAAPAYTAGRTGKAADLDGTRYLSAGDVGDFGFYDKFTCSAWVRPRGTKGGTILSRMVDTARADGYSLTLEDGNRLRVHLSKRWLDDAIHVEAESPLPADQWQHVAFTYDGSRVAAGVRLYVDGRPVPVKVLLDELNQSFQNKQPFRIGAGGGPASRFHGAVQDVRIYSACLPEETLALLPVVERIDEIAALPAAKRTPAQQAKLAAYFRERQAPEPARAAWREVQRLRAERAAFRESLPTVMVMEEMPRPRETHVLVRGQYDKPGEKVRPGVPAVLPALPTTPRNDRLALARWLVRPDHPLTARVAVNRLWQQQFGIGLVKTVDDFGSQGEWPSHPELLDWLATEFVRLGWDVKALQRLIVTSATYRQSSKTPPALLARDPENRLLARGPRFRLSAEMIRDQALAVSGLLVERQGGPSVRPYQPAGLWKDLTGTEDYVQDHGPSLYRRSLYTFWKRTVAPPMMMTFDASGREVCVVRETRTNTPLQALNLLNDVTFVEAARVLAQRVLEEGPASDNERVTRLFRRLTARAPKAAELHVLADGLARYREDFRRDPAAARKLLRIGEYPAAAQLDQTELAAYATLASLVLNLDEVVTRE
jgi:hypothetical protein